MKKKVLLFSCLLAALFLGSVDSFAATAAQFKGWYKVISRTDVSVQADQYLMVDVDTLGNIWKKYADGDLPADLEKYREESTILAAFTDRNLYFMDFEKLATVGNDFLGIDGTGTNRFELKRRPDSKFDMAVKEKNKISIYLLNTPQEEPDSLKNH